MIDVIIVPQGAEHQAVKKGLNKLQRKQPLLVSIPIGSDRIEKSLTEQNFWQSQPKKVLMMGLCGSLSSQFTVGDAVLYRDSFSQKTKAKRSTNLQLNQIIQDKINLPSSHYLVSSVTSNSIIYSIHKKQQLAQEFNASVVDMESFSYLKLLQQKEIAVSILRIVSDDLKYEIPNLESAISDRGEIEPLAMARVMLKQPFTSFRFIKSSLQGLNSLQQITTSLLDN